MNFSEDFVNSFLFEVYASKMLFKAFDDYVIFGWYYMAEFGYHNNSTASSNSFELYLFDYNDSATVCGDNDDDGCTDAERANVNKPQTIA